MFPEAKVPKSAKIKKPVEVKLKREWIFNEG
jgi:hypothetical protein